jgi:hypothetical protein
MSYKLKILKDYPIGFWQLDDVAINAEFNFTDILENFNSYQDLLDNYNQYGSINYIATDSSGCGNDGLYIGNFNNSKQHIPLSPGGQYAIDITSSKSIEFPIINSYYQQQAPGGFATKYYNDNDFTLECWISPEIITDNLTTIFGDASKNIGIFWKNGNIIFKLDTDQIEYTIPFINKSFHIVCVYSVNQAFIYLDGELVVSKNLTSNLFTNSEILLKCGPTQNLKDVFLVDDIAIYRYSLSQKQILDHYNDKGYTIPSQIASPDDGEIFEFYDNNINTSFRYSYPLNKSWEYFLTPDLYYDENNNYIQLLKTDSLMSKVIILTDTITIPAGIPMDSSKIEWYGDNGIIVATSIDGETYQRCYNGESIPQYSYSDFSTEKLIYLKIIITSEDTSRYLPKLKNLSIYFYNEQIMYSKNGGSYLSKIDNCNYYLGLNKYPIISKDKRNGILVPYGSGFNINTQNNINSIEFFYTPLDSLPGFKAEITNISSSTNNIINAEINSISSESPLSSAQTTDLAILSTGCLILQELSGVEYSYGESGIITSSGISSIYVNGVNKTGETNILNVFTKNNLHHVVINFEEPITGQITFNHNGTESAKALYQYMSLYQNNLSLNTINNHFNLYTGKQAYQTLGVTLAMSENSVNLYNNDWLVIQNV